MLSDAQRTELRKKCEGYGETRTREKLKASHFNQDKVPIIEEWLREQELEREKLGKREELDIAREANQIARGANKLSSIALIIAVISVVISLIVAIFK